MADIKFQAPEKASDDSPGIVVLRFADSAVPVFKETRSKDYIKYGENNLYPDYLNLLYNKSAKHNAIINGKSNYIFGNGYQNGDFIINRSGESLNDISKKAIKDIEIYGGFKLEIIWNFKKQISEIYHVDYSTIRKGKDGGFYFKQSWEPSCRDEEEFIEGFNPTKPVGSQIFEYNEYRPGIRYYPLPGYIGSNNYIETDIEISKYYLSAIKNGMMPSKMIQFYEGSNVTDDKKREIERRWKDKFTGSENAGKFVLVFNSTKDKQVSVDDLSASELDKHFQELNKTTQQEIYAGHSITSPMLFGIKTEGQLGGTGELNIAYSIFKNTYAKPKADAFDKEINWILSYSMFPGKYELQETDPIGLQFDVKDVVNSLPKQFVFENLGIPKEMWELENIGADNRPTPTTPIAPNTDVTAPGGMANDAVRSLSAKQHQQLMRIIRQYSKGQLLEPAARALLKTSLQLSDEDINSILGVPVQMSFSSDDVINIFDEYGDSKNDFEILKSKKVNFSAVEEAEQDEAIFIQEAFKDVHDLTASEGKIVTMIEKDPLITPTIIAATIKETVAYVTQKIKSLIARGFIEQTEEMIGEDVLLKRIIPKGIDIYIPPTKSKVNPTQIYIKYSYEGPEDSRNRPFCAKLLTLNRLYSRAQIEEISQRLGYSVFDRGGGFWMQHDGTVLPHCRHHWKSNILVKKGGSNVS